METIAVLVDDAEHAARILKSMRAAEGETAWVLVACAPRLTHRIGKWVSHSNREQWRAHWCGQLFDKLRAAMPALKFEARVAKQPLNEVVARLRAEFGTGLRVLDGRRPKAGHTNEAASGAAATATENRWAVPIAVSSGLSVVLALSD